ncbi:hypothetical protein HY621_04310 [Candidatus Uhrbacteria bacterium]|nr:hypothetical protein [Candidatus Uhrbacteria bacterium]
MHYLISLLLFFPSVVQADLIVNGFKHSDPRSYEFEFTPPSLINIILTLFPLVLVIVFVFFIIFVFRRTDSIVKNAKVALPGFSKLFIETWRLFCDRFKSIAGLSFICFLLCLFGIVTIVGWLIATLYFSFPFLILLMISLCALTSLMWSSIVSRMLTALTTLFIAKEPIPGAVHCYRQNAKKIIFIWWILFLSGLITLGASIAYWVPALILSIFFQFLAFTVLIDDKRGIDALYASYQLVHNAWWKVFGRLLLLSFCFLGIFFGAGIVLGLLTWLFATIVSPLVGSKYNSLLLSLYISSGVVFLLIGSFLFSFATLFSYKLYLALKEIKNTALLTRSSLVFRVMCIFFAVASIAYVSLFYFQSQEILISRGINTFDGKIILDRVIREFIVPEQKQESNFLSPTENKKYQRNPPLDSARDVDLEGYTGKPEDAFFTIYKSTGRDFSVKLLTPRKWNFQQEGPSYLFKRLDEGVQFLVARDEQERQSTRDFARDALESIKSTYPADSETLNSVEIQDAFVGFTQPASLFSVTVKPGGVRVKQNVYSIIVDGIPILVSAVAREEDFPFYEPIFQKMIDTLSIQKLVIPQEVGLDSSYRPSVINLHYRTEKTDEHPYYYADFWKKGKKENEYIYGKRIVIDARTGKKVTDETVLKEFYARDEDLLDGIDPKTRLNVDEKNRPFAPSFGDGKILVFSPDEILTSTETIKESYGPTAAVSNPQLFYSKFNIAYWYLDLYTTKKDKDQQQWQKRLVFDTLTGALMTEDKEYMKDTLSELGALKGQVPEGIDPKTRLRIEEK